MLGCISYLLFTSCCDYERSSCQYHESRVEDRTQGKEVIKVENSKGGEDIQVRYVQSYGSLNILIDGQSQGYCYLLGKGHADQWIYVL